MPLSVPGSYLPILHLVQSSFGQNVRFLCFPNLLIPTGFSTVFFSKIKLPLKGKRLDTIEVIQENVINIMKTLKKGDFKEWFHTWDCNWSQCVVA
jgi:hypothetical protein